MRCLLRPILFARGSCRASRLLSTATPRDIKTYTRRELLEILGTTPEGVGKSTLEELYKTMAKQKHPDVGGNETDFQLLTAARERLEEIGMRTAKPKAREQEARAGGMSSGAEEEEEDTALAATITLRSLLRGGAYAQAFEYLEEAAALSDEAGPTLDGETFELGSKATGEYCISTGGGMELAVELLVKICDRALESGALERKEQWV